MSEQEHRRVGEAAPMVPAALAVAAGVLLDRLAAPGGTLAWAALAAATAVAAVVGWRHRWGAVALAASLAAVGGGWHHYRWSDLAPDDLARADLRAGRPAWVRGVVEDVATFRPGPKPEDEGTTRTTLVVGAVHDGGAWRRASGRVLLRVGGDRTDLAAGSAAEAAGRLEAVPGPLNPGEFDARDYLRAQGIRLTLSVDDPEGVWGVEGGPGWSRARLLGRARAWSHRTLVGGLDPRAAPLAAALLLGRREGVDPEINDAFARTGTTHLLAISGLHLQVLAGVLWVACRAAGLRRSWAFALVIAATAGYAALVGLAPSVVRSAAMTIMACLAGLRDRTVRPANVLALAALATIALNPAHLFDVGCQLSFLAVAMIAWAVGPAADWLRFGYHALTFRFQKSDGTLDRLERTFLPWWRKLPARLSGLLFEGAVLSAVIWLAALPLVMVRFHLASPVGVLLNLPLIPLTSLALLAAGLTLPLAALWGPLAKGPGWVCAKSIGLTEWLVRAGAGWRWGHWFVAGPPAWWAVGFYAGLALLIAGRRRGAALALGAWVALGLGLMARPDRPGGMEAEVLAVGHGLATLVRAPDGRAILYDCGKLADPGVGRRIVAPALWARGVRRLDAVILSHADSDHYDGLPDLLDRVPVGAVLVPPGFAGAANPGAVALAEAIRARGVPLRTIAAGDRVEFGRDADLTVLHPPADWRPGTSSDNARSVVLDVASGGRHLLLTGDLEGPGLAALLAEHRPAPDALLSPHHGGRTANPPALYRWADRATVLVSQRRGGAGARDPLAPLEARGVPVLRTWQRGAIRLRWSPSGLAAAGFLDTAPALAMAIPDFERIGVGLLGLALGGSACFALAVVEWGAWTLVVPGRKGLGADPAFPPPWEPIEARAADGVALRGHWRPAEGPARGLALLLHGFGERGEALRGRAEALASLGWSIAVPDARGQGLSGGDRMSFGGREAGDARAWLDALADRLPPGRPVVAWGRSMGAAIALRAAADPRLSALILEAPYPDLADAVASVLRRLRIPLSRAWAGPMLRRAGWIAGAPLASPRPVDVAPSVRLPVLILHGSDDPLVPLAEARRLADAFPGPAELVEVEGARHQDVFEVGGAELAGRIAEFLGRAGD